MMICDSQTNQEKTVSSDNWSHLVTKHFVLKQFSICMTANFFFNLLNQKGKKQNLWSLFFPQESETGGSKKGSHAQMLTILIVSKDQVMVLNNDIKSTTK